MSLSVQTVSVLFVLLGLNISYAQNVSSLLTDRLYLKVNTNNSTQIIETEELRKLYELNGMANFWTQNARPNESAQVLKQILTTADRYGLMPSNYWNSNLESLYNGMTERNAITFELMLTDSYYRFAKELSNGQVQDPDLIDEDIKMTQKNFDQHAALVEISKSPQSMRERLEGLAPQHNNYKKLLKALQKLQKLESDNTWGTLADPGGDIKPGQSHASIPELKKRLSDLGYGLEQNRTVYFDEEMQAAVKRYQEMNRLPVIRNISRSLYASLIPDLRERIERVQANLEKFRWFQRQWEDRYMYVNLAFQELTISENHKVIMQMKTVNGRPTRRTPTLRDEIRYVELNPTWTVPHSIATKDKLSQLQNNPQALESQNIWIYDRANQIVNPAQVDWHSYSRTYFPFTLVQQPGSYNALGHVKFPLTNPWFIYLHDTSEQYLMKESNRLKSSGCVRLERAFDLAQYLLKDQSDWNMEKLRSQKNPQTRVNVKKRLPVYFIYQTVDMTDKGELRMAPDDYGQDRRLSELFKSRGSNEKF